MPDESEHQELVINDQSGYKHPIVDQSSPLYAFLNDQSDKRFLLKASWKDGSSFWSFRGEYWDDTHWHFDGSWVP